MGLVNPEAEGRHWGGGGRGRGAKPPHESGRPKADFFDFSTLGGLIKVCALGTLRGRPRRKEMKEMRINKPKWKN